ncbi:MAG TPA: hypothetical protein PK257_02045 [Candidatus Woesebacteria bacterium]|nr:hypothetical protein [Candidatus Woesebacteria bacterium]
MNNKLKIILPIVLVSSSALVLFQIKNDSVSVTSNSTNSNEINSNLTDELNSTNQFQQLSVLGNRCRGCGRCVQIDPLHFEMQGRVATIISSINLDSSKLAIAINNCPSQAIILE